MSYQNRPRRRRRVTNTPVGWPIPSTVWSFAPNRVPEHPDIVLGSYIQEPFLGQDAASPDQVDRTLLQSLSTPQPGYTLVPSAHIREYVKMQIMTAAIGFGIGMTVGAVAGPIALSLVRSIFGR